MNFRIVRIGGTQLDADTSMPSVQAVSGTGIGDTAQNENVQVFGALGVTALPYQSDSRGWCEGLAAKDISGLDTVIVAFRETRAASIYGNLQPGDTCLHSTGPSLASQVLLKEDEQQVAILTKDANGKDCGIIIDGLNEEFTITVFGCLISMKRSGAIAIGNNFGCFGVDETGRFFANTPGGALGASAAAPAQGIAYGVAGPVNLTSASWSVSS